MENHFNNIYNSELVASIVFSESWKNGTGYYDRATEVEVPVGVVVKSYDETTKRKLLLIGTRLGAIVIFERYSEGAKGIYVSNTPACMPSSFVRILGLGSSINHNDFEHLLGNPGGRMNIGQVIEQLFNFEHKKVKMLTDY